jgi:hypothetical protein
VEKQKADEELERALPIVQDAENKLKVLKPSDLVTLRVRLQIFLIMIPLANHSILQSFTNPPDPIRIMCYQIICLRPIPPPGDKFEENWTDGKRLLGHPQLLSSLQNYRKDDIQPAQIRKVLKQHSHITMT